MTCHAGWPHRDGRRGRGAGGLRAPAFVIPERRPSAAKDHVSGIHASPSVPAIRCTTRRATGGRRPLPPPSPSSHRPAPFRPSPRLRHPGTASERSAGRRIRDPCLGAGHRAGRWRRNGASSAPSSHPTPLEAWIPGLRLRSGFARDDEGEGGPRQRQGRGTQRRRRQMQRPSRRAPSTQLHMSTCRRHRNPPPRPPLSASFRGRAAEPGIQSGDRGGKARRSCPRPGRRRSGFRVPLRGPGMTCHTGWPHRDGRRGRGAGGRHPPPSSSRNAASSVARRRVSGIHASAQVIERDDGEGPVGRLHRPAGAGRQKTMPSRIFSDHIMTSSSPSPETSASRPNEVDALTRAVKPAPNRAERSSKASSVAVVSPPEKR